MRSLRKISVSVFDSFASQRRWLIRGNFEKSGHISKCTALYRLQNLCALSSFWRTVINYTAKSWQTGRNIMHHKAKRILSKYFWVKHSIYICVLWKYIKKTWNTRKSTVIRDSRIWILFPQETIFPLADALIRRYCQLELKQWRNVGVYSRKWIAFYIDVTRLCIPCIIEERAVVYDGIDANLWELIFLRELPFLSCTKGIFDCFVYIAQCFENMYTIIDRSLRVLLGSVTSGIHLSDYSEPQPSAFDT